MRRFPDYSEFCAGFPGIFRCELPEARGVDHTTCTRARGKTRRSRAQSDTGKQQLETATQRRRTRVCKPDRDTNSGSSQRSTRARRALRTRSDPVARRSPSHPPISRLLERSQSFEYSREFSAKRPEDGAYRRATPPNGTARPRRAARNAPSDRLLRAVPASPQAVAPTSGTTR
jgi:hypothetical protein